MFGKIEYKLLIENYMTKDEYKKLIEEYMDKYTISYANATQLIMSKQIERFDSRSYRAGAGLRLTQRSFYIIISLPALPGNRIRGPVQARAAPAKVTVPRPSPSGMLRGHWCTVRRPGADVGEASPVTSEET